MFRHVVGPCRGRVLFSAPFQRNLKTSVADLRKGDWIDHDGKVQVINQINSTFSGRGARNYLMMLKDPIFDTVTAVKPSARDFFEKLELTDIVHQYLYTADDMLHLLNPTTLEELAVPSRLLGGNMAGILEGGLHVKVRLHGEKPVFVHPNLRNYTCTVAVVLERRDGGDRRTTVVEVQGGARVQCSAVLEVGDQIVVSVEDLSFQGRPLTLNPKSC